MKKLRNLSKIFIFALCIAFSGITRAEDEPTNFKTFPATVIFDAKTYSGYLISDLEYDRYFRLEVEYNNILEKYNILLDYKNFIDPKFNQIEEKIDDSFFEIQKLAFKKESWFESNKEWIFLTGGIIIGSIGTYFIYNGALN